MCKMKTIVHGSTFSGIGGPEVAAMMLGWKNAFHCEINEFGRKVLDYWFPEAESYEDITKTDFTKWQGKIDVLTGGFPCQPFSYSGQRKGAEDDRYIWPFMLRCIEQVKPNWFVGENVAGIATMALPGVYVKMGSCADIFEESYMVRREQQFVLEEICENLEGIGYSVQPMLIPACAVSAPHRRDRIFIIANKVVTDTDIDRRGEIHEHIQSKFSNGEEPFGNGWERNVTDTQSITRNDGELGVEESSKSRFPEFRECDGKSYPRAEGLFPDERWRTFPTVPAVYRGNDGIPFDVDSLTIPFTRWKRESLKAYGNAIVPQVMYEIFRAIQEIEENGQ